MSAIWVLVSIVVGGGLFGFIGMLLGVPLYMLTKEFVAARLQEKEIDGNGRPLPQQEDENTPEDN